VVFGVYGILQELSRHLISQLKPGDGVTGQQRLCLLLVQWGLMLRVPICRRRKERTLPDNTRYLQAPIQQQHPSPPRKVKRAPPYP